MHGPNGKEHATEPPPWRGLRRRVEAGFRRVDGSVVVSKNRLPKKAPLEDRLGISIAFMARIGSHRLASDVSINRPARAATERIKIMSNVPQLGVYQSDDNKNFKIEITAADPSNGQIQCSYSTTYSPEGPFTDKAAIGHYAWVFSDQQGKDGVAPFNIRIIGSIRPDKRPYCIVDTWNGAYQTDNTLLMEGSRAYVNSKGVIQVGSLGTLRFKR
jgi:hypothetical protein